MGIYRRCSYSRMVSVCHAVSMNVNIEKTLLKTYHAQRINDDSTDVRACLVCNLKPVINSWMTYGLSPSSCIRVTTPVASNSMSTNKMFRFPNGIILASVVSMDSWDVILEEKLAAPADFGFDPHSTAHKSNEEF